MTPYFKRENSALVKMIYIWNYNVAMVTFTTGPKCPGLKMLQIMDVICHP